jgi:two-component sensor histidine kinase
VIELVCYPQSIMLPLDSVTAIGMVVAELVTNSYRHAFPNKEGTIAVTLARSVDANTANLTIQDDGVGFVVNAETSRRGMDLAKRLTEQIGGTLSMRSEEGTLCTLVFPVPGPSGGFKVAA